MIELGAVIAAALAAMSAAERSAAGSYEYVQVEAELDKLSDALNAAMAADDAEAHAFWAKLAALMPLSIVQIAAKALLNAQSSQAKASAIAALGALRALCAVSIGIHAPVPAQLEEDSKGWLMNQREVEGRIPKCQGLKTVPGWSDKGKTNYDLAVDVQVEALDELKGIMASTAQSCKAGALLNRAVFYVVAKAIRRASGTIRSAPGSSGLTFYRRTSVAVNAIRELLGEIQAAQGGEVAAGSANALSVELRKTVMMPNLLQVGSWPSGTTMAGRAAANTEEGVTSSGTDADLAIPAKG